MAMEVDLPNEELIYQLFQHFGIQQAHVAASMPADWMGFALSHPECISSLTLVFPRSIDPRAVAVFTSRLLVITGDQGKPAEELRRTVSNLPGATLLALRDYSSAGSWLDMVADRTEEIGLTMMKLLARMSQERNVKGVSLPEGEGEVAGISYRVEGSGPPLLLFPLALALSQWEPLMPKLRERFCTITLSGAKMGQVATLEERARGGYLRVVQTLIEESQLRPGESVLDVGCGTGALDRWLAHYTNGKNRVVAVDNNGYLLREATTLARKEGLEGAVEFREGNAEDLPFVSGSFDVVLACTLLERLDADRALRKLVRVTKPGGRVGVVVRALDVSWFVNVPLRTELKRRVEDPGTIGGSVAELGCADASLYRRICQQGLVLVKMLPQLATVNDGMRLQLFKDRIFTALSSEQKKEWEDAAARAESDGSFFYAEPYHCAVGTKP